jgi:flagellar basal body-associated protein FliL
MQPQDSKKPSKGYGKRSKWQWVIIYLVVAIVVYGLIYYVFIRKSGGTSPYSY